MSNNPSSICKKIAQTIQRIDGVTPIGCSDSVIELITTSLRELLHCCTSAKDFKSPLDFVSLWRYLQLPSEPTINAYHFSAVQCDLSMIANCFGAEEVPASNELATITAVNSITNEREVMPSSHAVCWTASGNDSSIDCTTGKNDPFIFESMTFSTFFKSTVIYVQGTEISREQLIEYAGYVLGHIHANAYKYEGKKENIPVINAMKIYENHFQAFQRDNVKYLLLSIARDITQSTDMAKFVATANSLQ